jgi:hypothetical protein
MDNATASMLDHEEIVNLLARQRRHCEKIEGDDQFAMVSQERKPTLSALFPTRAPEITRDSSSETSKPSFNNPP